MLYERTAISKKPELIIVNDLKQLSEKNKMTTDLFFREPYVLDFLQLQDTYSEKDIENAILADLEEFILEIKRDFAFLGRQVRITVGQYLTLLPPKELFQEKLHKAIERAKENFGAKELEE